ncbi:hypothetical protein ACFQ6N_09575 [Kitasatospora sp. NPDC056446]
MNERTGRTEPPAAGPEFGPGTTAPAARSTAAPRHPGAGAAIDTTEDRA